MINFEAVASAEVSFFVAGKVVTILPYLMVPPS